MSANPADLMTITEFCHLYPEYAFSPGRPQPKCWEPPTTIPVELAPLVAGAVKSKRGQPSPNQTLTHHQCLICGRVLRNDQFNQSGYHTRDNVGYPYCRECSNRKDRARYRHIAGDHTALRLRIWQYIAPACAVCGFDKHTAAIDMHHVRGEKRGIVAQFVKSLAAAPSVANARSLSDEVAKCVPLCANCHRLIHAGVVSLPDDLCPQVFSPAELLALVNDGNEEILEQAELIGY